MTKRRKKVEELPVTGLADGEVKVIAKTKLLMNRGRLKVEAGTIVILGPEDRKQGVNIEKLIECGAVEIYQEEVKNGESSGEVVKGICQ